MLFIAEDPIQYGIRPETPAVFDTHGRMVAQKQRRIVIKFDRGHAPQWVRDIALARFEFRKRPVEIPPEAWVSSYDSIEDQVVQGWTDEERKEIERVLSQAFDVIVVERPKLEKPWPTIDKITVHGQRTVAKAAEKLAEVAAEIGVDLDAVIAYVTQESGNVNGWDDRLVAELESRKPAPVPEPEVEVVAA